MRIRVGMKVEALITEEATNMGAWRAGEVIWGNGHSYVMRWADGGPDSARISRKFVRPSPDVDVGLPDDLDAGDIVELFDCDLWKWAEVLRVLGDRQIDVKIVGSTKVVTADRTALRPRLIYGEKGWTLIHKNDKIPIESAVPSRPIAGKNLKSKPIGNGIGSNFAAHAVKLGKTKRSNYTMDADIVRDVKRFQGNGGDSNNRVFATREEPAAARYNGNMEVMEVMDVHPSHYLEKRQHTGSNADIFLARRTDKDNADCHLAPRTDKDDDDDDASSNSDTSSSSSDSSSSGSSSSSGDNSNGGDSALSATAEYCQANKKAEIQLLPSCNEEEQDSHNRTEHRPANNEVKVEVKQEEQHDRRVHGLELEAYESVMKAFHATGSLSWTKEELLCNLRLHLHVSSDEHLQIIRRLNGEKKPASGPRSGHC
ncbi:unnamed protein product [Alopecurus aequalis]